MLRIDEDLTFRKLEALLAYMEAGGLTHEDQGLLGVSAVSVHRALHSLEEAMRCPLFRHEGRNLNPTDAAHVLAQVARDVLKAMDDGIRATRDAAGYAAPRLRIGSLYSLTIKTVPDIVIALKLRKPELGTELLLGSNLDLLARLRQGVVDAALIAVPSDDPELIDHAVRGRHPLRRARRLEVRRTRRDRPARVRRRALRHADEGSSPTTVSSTPARSPDSTPRWS